MLLPEGFLKTTGILISMSRVFGKPYGATGLGLFAERIAQFRLYYDIMYKSNSNIAHY